MNNAEGATCDPPQLANVQSAVWTLPGWKNAPGSYCLVRTGHSRGLGETGCQAAILLAPGKSKW
jgi:hypothetical protein